MYNDAGEEQKLRGEVDWGGGERRISTRRKEREEGDWTRPIGRRSQWSWRSTVTPSRKEGNALFNDYMASHIR